MQILEDDTSRTNARTQVLADLMRRSFAGPIGTLLVMALLLFSTRLYIDYPLVTGAYVGLMVLRIVVRVVLTLKAKRTSSSPPLFPRWLIALSAYTLSLPTGLFTAFVIAHYGYESWNTLAMFAYALACGTSGSMTMAPDLEMALVFQTTLLAPIVATTSWMGHAQGYILAVSTAIFAVYVVLQVYRLHADYLRQVESDLALKMRAEQLEAARSAADAANRAKSRFLASMSHEIRTPMNGVLGMVGIVLQTKLTAEQREYLQDAEECAQSLLRLLNDILDESKAESGRLELEELEFAVRPVIADSLSPFQVQAAAKQIALNLAIETNVPQMLRGDPTRLRQVIMNLVSNALKFTQSGSVAVSVNRDSMRDGKMFLHFRVADTGPGIPADKLNTVFDAFSQADSSITRRFGGTGLGLAICRHLVTLMGGRIWVESEPGRGSTFHFIAGFGRCSAVVSSQPAPVEPQPERPKGRGLRILVAEDNRINQKLLATLLVRAGHTIDLAVTGREVLAMLDGQTFDAILMDVEMPEMDGIEATRQIRAAEASTGRHVPIVGVTAAASEEDVARCVAAGMDACITKPIHVPRLEELLARIAAGLGIDQVPGADAPASTRPT